MKKLFFFLLVLLNLTVVNAQVKLDTSNYTVINNNTMHSTTLEKGYKFADLTEIEISQLEVILTKSIDNYNSTEIKYCDSVNQKITRRNRKIHPHLIVDISKYKMQFIVTISPKGEKTVWANCFCSSANDVAFKNWRQDIVIVSDGGQCFFNLDINLTTKEFTTLSVNGVA